MPARCAPPHAAPAAAAELAELHPFQKLVIGLPTAMADWNRLYGPAREWSKLPPNPTIAMPPSDGRSAATKLGAPVPPPPRNQPRAAAGLPEDASASEKAHRKGVAPTGVSSTAAAGASGPLYCDSCQRDFTTPDAYAVHMDSHVYCTVAGCRFTCRKNKPWKMEEHMELLHNRPDAPNLADTSAYLDQRKCRYPTQDAVKSKVEELYYKAARGVVLPDERRRWMQQHGIVIRKRPRTDASFIARGELPVESRSPSPASSISRSPSRSSSGSPPLSPGGPRGVRPQGRCPPLEDAARVRSPPAEAPADGRSRFIQPPLATSCAGDDPTAPPPRTDVCAGSATPASPPLPPSTSPASTKSMTSAAAAAHPTKIIPLGPNGTLTPRQRVQLVRERYAAAKEVPRFYVCHRCGTKGEHWVSDCPTKGDHTYDRRVVWGEAKLSAPDRKAKPHRAANVEGSEAAEQRTGVGDIQSAVPPEELARVSSVAAASEEAVEQQVPAEVPATASGEVGEGRDAPAVDEEDDAPPLPQSTAPPAGPPRELTRTMAPVAAGRASQRHRRDRICRPPPPPTLYERLTEEERMDEQGVLLQALRFMVVRDFFQERPTS